MKQTSRQDLDFKKQLENVFVANVLEAADELQFREKRQRDYPEADDLKRNEPGLHHLAVGHKDKLKVSCCTVYH